MQAPNRYIKDTVFKNIKQAQYGHPMIPFFFADKGEMPDSKNRSKKCFLLMNMAGIYFFREKKLSRETFLKDFLSIFDIIEIQYIDPKKKKIVSKKHREMVISCERSDILMANIKYSNDFFAHAVRGITPITFSNFSPPVPSSPLPPINENFFVLALVRDMREMGG